MSEIDYGKISGILGGKVTDIGPNTFGPMGAVVGGTIASLRNSSSDRRRIHIKYFKCCRSSGAYRNGVLVGGPGCMCAGNSRSDAELCSSSTNGNTVETLVELTP